MKMGILNFNNFFLGLYFLFLAGCDLTQKRIHVGGDFYIEYMEMYGSISLCNSYQGFIGNIQKALWNEDSLIVHGTKEVYSKEHSALKEEEGCFLIILGVATNNDDMEKIDCRYFQNTLKKGPIQSYKKGDWD